MLISFFSQKKWNPQKYSTLRSKHFEVWCLELDNNHLETMAFSHQVCMSQNRKYEVRVCLCIKVSRILDRTNGVE